MPIGERRLLEPGELWPQEQRLCAKAADGGLLDLRSRCQEEDDPTRGREWGSERRIRAQVLFQLLTGHGPKLINTEIDAVVAVRLRGAQIVGRLNLGGWKLRCPLELSQCYLHHRTDLAKAVAPNLNLRGSYLRSRLSARRLRVADTLSLSSGFRCDRGVVVREAHIGGRLDCDEAVFTGSTSTSGRALSADGLVVDGGMFLRKAQCTGQVRLPGAHISGRLECSKALFVNPDGDALTANGLTADSGMFLRKVQCTGQVRLLGAHISGPLECTGATFVNPDGVALNADRLVVDGMFLGQAQCTGQVRLSGAHISGQLACEHATFINPDRLAVDLEGASVAKEVLMRPAVLEGGLDLTRARVGAWHDAKETWPRRLELGGFAYDSIHAPDATIKDRLRFWLPRNNYLPQPYEQLAGVYRREGHDWAARTVAIGKQRARRAGPARWWIRWPSVGWSAVLRWTIGYGYRPVLALVPLAVLLVAGSLLFMVASHYPELLRPAKAGPEQPSFNSFRYTMDLLLPVVNFKQRDSFVAEGWAAWVAFGFTFAGWLLAAVVVAGLSGVFKRD